jgi:hypothetical protein
MSGLVLRLEIMAMNGLIPVSPQSKEGSPNRGERPKQPVCSCLRACAKLVLADVGVLKEAPLAGEATVEDMTPSN